MESMTLEYRLVCSFHSSKSRWGILLMTLKPRSSWLISPGLTSCLGMGALSAPDRPESFRDRPRSPPLSPSRDDLQAQNWWSITIERLLYPVTGWSLPRLLFIICTTINGSGSACLRFSPRLEAILWSTFLTSDKEKELLRNTSVFFCNFFLKLTPIKKRSPIAWQLAVNWRSK